MERFSKLEKAIAAIYFVWFFANLITFFYSENDPDNKIFWPFDTGGTPLLLAYDITEFTVYTGVPLIFFASYRLFFARPYIEPEHHHQHHSSGSFFIAFLNEKIRAEELAQKINAAENRPVNTDYLNELKADRERASATGINGWLSRVEVKKKYKDFEK